MILQWKVWGENMIKLLHKIKDEAQCVNLLYLFFSYNTGKITVNRNDFIRRNCALFT